jgi:hypothetical protein
MKIPALLAMLALASGTAFAQSTSAGDASTSGAAGPGTPTTMKADKAPTAKKSGDTVTAKAKRGAKKVGAKIKHAGHKAADAARRITGNDTQQMGASPADDPDRRARMDAAYENWKRQQ